MTALAARMETMPLSALLQRTLERDPEIAALAMDSRDVVPGALFLACAGHSAHGLEYLAQALDRGAVAVAWEPDGAWDRQRVAALEAPVPLIEVPGLGRRVSHIAGRFHADPSTDLDLIGVTGTNGKTSCALFIAQALAPDLPCGVIGTIGNGYPGELRPGRHTTPDPVRLQALLAQFRDRGAGAVAMEVSSHALDQDRAAALRFDLAVLTNLSRDHLDYHGDMESYAEAKKRLFHAPGLEAAVINLDDELGRTLAGELAGGPQLIGYGCGREPDRASVDRWLHGEILAVDDDGLRVAISGSWGEGHLSTPLLGHFNVSNLLAVLGVLLQRGLPLEIALQRLGRLPGVPGRMQRFGGGERPLVVVDYAHTPDALEHVLTALRHHTRGRLICVFGCGGDRDTGKRPQMGAIAERLADLAVVTDDNPRGEDGDRIVAQILAGMERPEAARVQRDRAVAIRQAIGGARPGDLVVVAGKGHETSQEIRGVKHPFDDAEQVRRALREWPA